MAGAEHAEEATGMEEELLHLELDVAAGSLVVTEPHEMNGDLVERDSVD